MSHEPHVSSRDATLTQSTIAPPREAGFAALIVVPADGTSPASLRLDRPLTLGRDGGVEVVLAGDSAASRRHAVLSPIPGGARLVDLGSRNGTFVDGARRKQAELSPGATFRVGNTLCRLLALTEKWEPVVSGPPLVGGNSLVVVRRLVGLVGPTDMPVLVTGETGTGKEVVARQIHAASGRSRPLIAVNCAALPETLIESELFGHTRGAFTGAASARRGLFAAASGGTLFLDEVGDLPLPAQAKLLRVLEDGLVRPLGSETAQAVDARIVAATNRDLRRAVDEGQFRADLFARLAMVEIQMPALRERAEDIPALIAHLARRAGRAALAIAPDALEALMIYDWPHNVRELETVLRNALLGAPDAIGFDSLPERVRAHLHRRRGEPDAGAASASAPARSTGQDQRERFVVALAAHRGNVRQVSRALGISRGHVYRLFKKWGLDVEPFRRGAEAAGPDGTGLAPGKRTP